MKKLMFLVALLLSLSVVSFANTNNSTTDFRSNDDAISSTETLQVHLINEDVKTVSAVDEQNFTGGGGDSNCCGTCKIEINLWIIKISYEWCCNKCEEEEEPESVE